MMLFRKTLFVFIILFVFLSSCKKPGDPISGGGANVVSGDVYGASGAKFNYPNAYAQVYVWGHTAEGDILGKNIAVDGNGHYQLQVTKGIYGLSARAFFLLNGKKVSERLDPTDPNIQQDATVASDPGIRRDYKLKLTGPVQGGDPSTIQGYHGAHVCLTDGAYNFSSGSGFWDNLANWYPGGRVVVTLTPLSNAVDGSTVSTYTLDGNLTNMQQGDYKVNMPLAGYRASAKLIKADGSSFALKLSLLPDINSRNNTVDLWFTPDPADPDAVPSLANIACWVN